MQILQKKRHDVIFSETVNNKKRCSWKWLNYNIRKIYVSLPISQKIVNFSFVIIIFSREEIVDTE